MAITPTEAKTITEKDRELVALLESRIDEYLRMEFRHGSGPAYYSFPDGLGVTGRIREELVKRYEAAGWSITFHHDFRDGDYYCFTPRKDRNTNRR